MGWASYFENDLEKAHDRAFMALSFIYSADRPVDSRPPPQPTNIESQPAPAPVVAIAERWRQMRDVHVLCLAELRPKARLEYHAGV